MKKTVSILLPANICSSRHVLKTTSTRLQRNNFTSSNDVLEDEELLRWRSLQDVLKTSWRRILKTSWRNYGDKTKYLLGISASNKSKCVSKKSVFYKSIFENSQVNPKWIIRTHQFNICFILELKQYLYFKN